MNADGSESLPDEKSIADELVSYILLNNPSNYDEETLPRDTSLLEIGVLDSFGVIELVEFLEEHWGITIENDDITKEKMGSIQKMVRLIVSKKTS